MELVSVQNCPERNKKTNKTIFQNKYKFTYSTYLHIGNNPGNIFFKIFFFPSKTKTEKKKSFPSSVLSSTAVGFWNCPTLRKWHTTHEVYQFVFQIRTNKTKINISKAGPFVTPLWRIIFFPPQYIFPVFFFSIIYNTMDNGTLWVVGCRRCSFYRSKHKRK